MSNRRLNCVPGNREKTICDPSGDHSGLSLVPWATNSFRLLPSVLIVPMAEVLPEGKVTKAMVAPSGDHVGLQSADGGG